MNKIILGTMLAVSLVSAEVDYNKAMYKLGGNCKFEQEVSKEYRKYFTCDNGFIAFDFDDYEIVMSIDTLINGQNYKIHFLFNRAWDKGHQIHKEKSSIAIVEDEFGTVVNTSTGKWSGWVVHFYERFKEDVYYGKQETVEYKKNDETILTDTNEDYVPDGGWYCDTHDCPPSWKDSDGNCKKGW